MTSSVDGVRETTQWQTRRAAFGRHARDPRAKTADPQGFIDMRFVRELDQKGVIEQLYGEKR